MCNLIDIDYYDPSSCLIGPIKTRGRILEKAHNDYNGHIETISDGCRMMLLFDDARTIGKIHKSIIPGKNSSIFQRALQQTNFNFLQQPKDMITTPKKWGYMGFMMKFAPQKHQDTYTPFEIQITHRGLQENYYPLTHDLYESRRVLIEQYEQDQVPFEDWDEDTQNTVQNMLDLHREGAIRYGIAPYVKHWPTLVSDHLLDHEDDITPVEYGPMI